MYYDITIYSSYDDSGPEIEFMGCRRETDKEFESRKQSVRLSNKKNEERITYDAKVLKKTELAEYERLKKKYG